MKAVVERVIDTSLAGEKMLLFGFRSNTAHRLRDILGERIAAELSARARRCLGGEKSMLGRLTRRDGDLVVLGPDRVFWSALWALRDVAPWPGPSTSPPRTSTSWRGSVCAIASARRRCHPPRLLTGATGHVLARRLLRESVLVLLLPEREDRKERGWGELLVSAFFGLIRGQSESMAQRMGVFLERGEREPAGAVERPVRLAQGHPPQGRHLRLARPW